MNTRAARSTLADAVREPRSADIFNTRWTAGRRPPRSACYSDFDIVFTL